MVEAVFSWPGIGSWLVNAVRAQDLPDIQAFALLSTTVFVVLSLGVDTGTDCCAGWAATARMPSPRGTGRPRAVGMIALALSFNFLGVAMDDTLRGREVS